MQHITKCIYNLVIYVIRCKNRIMKCIKNKIESNWMNWYSFHSKPEWRRSHKIWRFQEIAFQWINYYTRLVVEFLFMVIQMDIPSDDVTLLTYPRQTISLTFIKFFCRKKNNNNYVYKISAKIKRRQWNCMIFSYFYWLIGFFFVSGL